MIRKYHIHTISTIIWRSGSHPGLHLKALSDSPLPWSGVQSIFFTEYGSSDTFIDEPYQFSLASLSIMLRLDGGQAGSRNYNYIGIKLLKAKL